MSTIQFHMALFFAPLILGNIIHMVVVKKDYLTFLKIPISIAHFGQNKTLRGFILLPVLCGLIAYLFSLTMGPMTTSILRDMGIGAGLGLVYMLSELPNSFVKRKLGIGNGEHSEQFKWFQLFVDKMDSILGVLLFYYFMVSVSWETLVIIFLCALGLHLLLSYLLVLLKIKKSI